MNTKEIVKTFITALQSGAIDMAAHYMTTDFKLVGWMPQPLDRGAFLTLQAQLDAGMPDFSYNLSDLCAHGDTVTGLIQIAATHTRDLAFPQFGIPTIQETGQAIGLPQVPVEFALNDGKVGDEDAGRAGRRHGGPAATTRQQSRHRAAHTTDQSTRQYCGITGDGGTHPLSGLRPGHGAGE